MSPLLDWRSLNAQHGIAQLNNQVKDIYVSAHFTSVSIPVHIYLFENIIYFIFQIWNREDHVGHSFFVRSCPQSEFPMYYRLSFPALTMNTLGAKCRI